MFQSYSRSKKVLANVNLIIENKFTQIKSETFYIFVACFIILLSTTVIVISLFLILQQ